MEFEALAKRRQLERKQDDLLAWMTGRYVTLALHAPKKYPRSPDIIREPPPEMTPGQMKQALRRIAAKRGETNGNC